MDESAITSDERIGGLVDERYRVLEAMASGSMGVVYKAERVPVGKLVAIKFLHAPFANDSEFLARFERETRVMSKLTHPNCVSVVDFGVWEGAPYLVMEYVSGTTLRALIDNGALPIKRALALVRQIAAGLAHAHAQGVVHRDVKPANIMISEEIGTGDHARILDFGLARLRGAVGRDATQSNIVVGTPNYMAPEQTVGGGQIDARTDIYAVGVVLFEMVSGERPFQAEDTLALLGMHRAAPVPKLSDRVPPDLVLPPGLQDIVEKAMAKSPGDRFQSAIELAEAIDAVTAARVTGEHRRSSGDSGVGHAPTLLDLDISNAVELVEPPPPRRVRRRGSFFGSLLLLAVLLGGVGATVWWVKLRNTGNKKLASAQTIPSGKSDPKSDVKDPKSDPRSDTKAPRSDSAPSANPTPAAPNPTAVPSNPSPTAAAPSTPNPAPDTADPRPAPAVPAGSNVPAQAPATGSDVPPSSAPAPVSPGTDTAPPTAAAVEPPTAVERPSDSDDPIAAGSTAEIEMDPATAEDPAPASTKPSVDADEAANAPRTAEEVARHVQSTPVRTTTLSGAVQLIKEGKRDQALAALHALWKKTPSSSYIPFLLGNLYYDQRWWSVAMDHYGAAIKKNTTYKRNPTLNRNVIRMLASNKTARRAQGFLKYTVGKPALPYVRYAAQRDSSSQVRRLSTWLARNI